MEADASDDATPAKAREIVLSRRYTIQALRLDPNNAEAHAVAGFLAYAFDSNYPQAEREFDRALNLAPGYATAHHWHAVMRFAEGDVSGAVREWELAHQLDPTSEVISRWLGTGYYYVGRSDEALAVLSQTLALQPNDGEAWLRLASVQEERGRYGDALRSLERVRRAIPHKGAYVAVLEARVKAVSRHGVADPGTVAFVERLAAAKRVSSEEEAAFFAALGSRDKALALLSHAAHSRLDLEMEKYDPRFSALRSDPRFKRIFG
jgi:tetratricopeptide (TPR) repeat protein